MCAQVTPGSLATSWTVAHQAPLSMGLSQQEYWSELPFPPPRNLPDPGMEPKSPVAPALAGGFFLFLSFFFFFTNEPPGKHLSVPLYIHSFGVSPHRAKQREF